MAWMRWIVVAAVALLAPVNVHAECRLTTGLSVNQFMPDLINALAADDIAAPTFVGLQRGKILVVVPPYNIVGIQLSETDDMLDEIDIGAMSKSLSDKDRSTFASAVAATASILSGTPLGEIKQQIDKGFQGFSGTGNFRLQWGETAAAISRIDAGIGARIGKRHCD